MKTPFSKSLIFIAFASVAIAAYGFENALQDRVGKITPWEAMKVAEARTSGKAIEAVYEFDDGAWGYAVYVAAKGKLYEVEISKTGKVGDVEGANPAEEAKELESDLNKAMKS